jgi:hypothetical protein
MSWIHNLFGVNEVVGGARTHIPGLEYSSGIISSKENNKSYRAGTLEIKSVGDLVLLAVDNIVTGPTTLRVLRDDVSRLQADPTNKHAVFQTASQFNCLEFQDQHITPEHGITRWVCDKTQGPAAAVSCGPGAVVRQYFAFKTKTGFAPQSRSRQINTLAGLQELIGPQYFEVQNGYIFATNEQLRSLNSFLKNSDIYSLINSIAVGILEDTQVTSYSWGTVSVDDPTQVVTQVICSACSVKYNTSDKALWEPFARLVLCAQYTAAIACAIINKHRTGVSKLFLAPLGGSAFGNDPEWIVDGIRHALDRFPECGLDITLVSWKDQELYSSLLGN